jgi:hypothetical protein
MENDTLHVAQATGPSLLDWCSRIQVHLWAPGSSLGKTSSLGMLLVRLEIIATTYHWTIFKTYAFSLYCHLCIYASIKLPINTRYIWTGITQRLRTFRGAPEDDDRVNSEIYYDTVIERHWRCTWRAWSSQFEDAIGDWDRVNSELHWEALIEQVWWCTSMLWSSEFGVAIGVWNWVNSDLHCEAVIEWVWNWTLRPKSRELRDALRGRDRASLMIQLETEIEWTKRCTSRLWSSEFGHALRSRCGRWKARQVLRFHSSVS